MLKVLFITSRRDPSGKSNVGDRVILAGARNLIAGAFGNYAYREVGRWANFGTDPDEYDLIVYAGMPQYGGRKNPTEVEMRVQGFLDRVKTATFINIGGGTPTTYDLDPAETASRMAGSGIASYYRDQQPRVAWRTARDKVSALFFKSAGIQCELRPCPSFFSTKHVAIPEKERNAMALLSDDSFVTARLAGPMQDYLEELIGRLPGYELVAHSKGDLGMLYRLGRPHVYFRSERDLIAYYSTVGKLASLRIHAAVPAWTLGADVVCGGFDSRIHMFEEVGMPIPHVKMLGPSFTMLADAVENPRLHLPVQDRLAKINAEFDRFTTELRVACPRVVDRAEESRAPGAGQTVPEGFERYPYEGSVRRSDRTNGFDLERTPARPVFVTEDQPGERGCVMISKGAHARNAERSEVELPMSLEGKSFRSEMGTVEGASLNIALSQKVGQIASGPELRLPFGDYRVEFDVCLKGDRARGGSQVALIAKTSHEKYAEKVIDLSVLSTGGPTTFGVDFNNKFPSAKLLLTLALRKAVAPATLEIKRVNITAR